MITDDVNDERRGIVSLAVFAAAVGFIFLTAWLHGEDRSGDHDCWTSCVPASTQGGG